MDLELRPAGLDVELVHFVAEVRRVLVLLFQVVGCQTDEVDLHGHSLPIAALKLSHKFFDIIDDACREDIKDVEGAESALHRLLLHGFAPKAFLLVRTQLVHEVDQWGHVHRQRQLEC